MAGRKRRGFSSITFLEQLVQMSDDELWDVWRNLVAARSGPTVSPNATLGEIINSFESSQGRPARLQDVLRPATLLPSTPNLPRPQIEANILAEEPWTSSQIQRLRWFYVCQALDQGERREDDGAYEYAEDILRGSPAEGGVDSMKKAYDAMQRDLPAAQQRPRTWRRRPVG